MKFKLPNTYALMALLLVAIALATWVAPGGRYERVEIDGRKVVDAASYVQMPAHAQGVTDVLMAPLKGFIESAGIIGFALMVGGAFGVLHRTGAIEAGIHRVVRAHERSPAVRALLIPLFFTLFSLGGATFGMAEEAIPFVLLFIPLALRLGYDSLIGVSLPFLGSQVGFGAAFLNPFNVGVAQGIAGLPVFSGIGYRFICWLVFTALAIAFLMWHAARIRRDPTLSPVHALDAQRSLAPESAEAGGSSVAGMSGRHRLVLLIMALSLVFMVHGVQSGTWAIEHLSALFLGMALLAGAAGGLSSSQWMDGFLHGARDMVGTALLIAMAKGTVVLMRDGQVIDSLLHGLVPVVESGSPVLAAQKMFLIQSVINFFIHSGTGQAALTMPLMGPLSDLVGLSRQTAVLAFQFGELSTPIIPTSGVTVGVMAISGLPFVLWVRWLLPLQLVFLVAALLLLIPPVLMGWQ